MDKLKKLILTILLLCSTSLFAGGFNTPMEAFNFYYKIAEKAKEYKDKNGHYSKKHIKALTPHMWSKRNPPQDAKIRISQHRGYILRAKNDSRGKYPMIVNVRTKKPYFARGQKRKGILTTPYAYYEHQHTRNNYRLFRLRAKQVGKKIKWFIN